MYKASNTIKIILLGEAGVGKTNLINVCCDLKFEENSQSSMTSSFLEKKVTIKETEFNLRIWDTAGQERFRCLNSLFINDSQICIFVYDVTRRDTFKEIEYWVKTVEEKLGKKPIFGLAGNKSDLYDETQVSQEDGENYAKEIGASFALTSAKVNKAGFVVFVNELVQKFLESNKFNEWEFVSDKKQKENIEINTKNGEKEKKSCCK